MKMILCNTKILVETFRWNVSTSEFIPQESKAQLTGDELDALSDRFRLTLTQIESAIATAHLMKAAAREHQKLGRTWQVSGV